MSRTEREQLEDFRARTRRDKFAAAALTGMCSSLTPACIAQIANGLTNAPEMILSTWKLADLMMRYGRPPRGVLDD